MKKIFTLFSLILLFQINSFSADITGKVLDSNEEPVVFANVILYQAMDSSFVKAEFTYDDGSYSIPVSKEGEYYLVINYLGLPDYQSDVFNFSDQANLDLGIFTMAEAENKLDEVTVVAKRPILEMKPDKMVFNVDGSINASGSDALELLKKAPGVIVDNNDNITLLGKSGVRVYIDDKPSPLSSEDLAAYLTTLQSDQIDNIEIITNPSAKYEAEGNAGIINIRLKKNENVGTSGSISQNFQQGEKSRYNGSFTGNWRAENTNLYGNLGYYKGGNNNDFNLYREQFGFRFDQRNESGGNWEGMHYRVGLDYFINKKSTFGILADGNINNGEWNSNSITDIGMANSTVIDSLLVAEGASNWDRMNNNINLNYRFNNGAGNTLNIDLDAGLYRNQKEELQPNFYKTADGSVILNERTNFIDSPTDIDIYTFKLDYEMPALGGNMGLGAKTSFVKTDNSYDFFDVIDDGNVIDEEQSNKYVYEELVNAVYGTYAKQFSKFNLQLGLRFEHTHSDGMLTAFIPTNDENVIRNYFDVFPSGGITYTPNQKNAFTLNYSRRLNRPNYQDLNPFRSKLDELTFELGNPFLRPEYTNNFQLSHNFKYRFTTTLGFSHTKDLITRFTDIESQTASYITWLNLADQYNYSINFAAPVSLTDWWSSYTSITGYLMKNSADYGDGKIVDLEQTSFNIYSQQTFALPSDLSLEVSGWYNSPSLWGGTFNMESMWNLDIGIQKKILNGQGNIKLSVSDVFKSSDWAGVSEFGELYMRVSGTNDSRRVRLSATYNFGNKKIRTRNRKTGLEDEARRIKSDN
jgi:outer membrane receptor protein involved in Fe transport